MLITLNSIVMTILCSTILIVLLSLLRMNLRFLEICSVSGIIILFLACMVRLVIPIEFSWTKVVQIRAVYNPVMLFFLKEIPLFGNIKMEINELLFVVWILGSLIGSVHLIRKYLVLNTSFSKLCCKPDEKANQIMLQIITEYKNKIHPTVFKSDRINTPIGFGLIKKQIFIPDREYDDSDLKYILMHEYTHFRNRDTWVKLLINIICILYWWNPCVYLLRRKLDDCFEIRCDKRVVEEIGIDQSAEYLAVILRIFQGVALNEEKRKSTAVNILPSSLSKLKERFTIVASYKKRKRKAIGILIPIAIVTGFIVLSYSFIFQAGFDVPLEEVEDRPGAYSIDINDSYYYKSEDGKYYMKTSGGTVVEIDEQYVEKLKEVGFPERGDIG